MSNEATQHTGLVAALIAAQGEFGKAVKDSLNPHFKSRYVDLQGVYDACRDALAAHGLTTIQTIDCGTSETKAILVTELAHVSGECRKSYYPLQPAKQNDPQALGACLTYARRYSLMALVGLAPEDDDGNEASGRDSGPKAPHKAPVQSVPVSVPVAAKPTEVVPAKAVPVPVKITPAHVQALQIEARKRLWDGANAEEHRAARLKLWCAAIKRDVGTATELLDSEFDVVMKTTQAQPMLRQAEVVK